VRNTETLVIACGNPLRGDDAVGHAAAERVIAWRLPDVRVLVVHQLAPELICELRQARRVVFIDAGLHSDAAYRVRDLTPSKTRRVFGHHECAENVLALLVDLEGAAPESWLLSVRAASFDHGAGLSAEASRGLEEAMSWLRRFLADPPCTKSA
jgi:hydrogenase maturation protease